MGQRLLRLIQLLVVGAVVVMASGCLRVQLDVRLVDDGAGSIGVEVAVDRGKIPGFLGDPLEGVGTPEDLQRYRGPGVVAWAEPARTKRGSWDVLTLRAFFDDIDELRFVRMRDAKAVDVLSFEYDREAAALGLRHDIAPELAEPLPIPTQPGSRIDEDTIRGAVGMLKPLLGDLELALDFTVPGVIERAAGFTATDGRRASVVADRDVVLAALREEAGLLFDSEAFLAENPAMLQWAPAKTPAAEIARHRAARSAAVAWWAEHGKPPAAPE